MMTTTSQIFPPSEQSKPLNGQSILRLTNVSRHFEVIDQKDPLKILTGVNLHVQEGDRIAIIGRSGSGKSTLLNLMGLLDNPSEGSIAYQGRDISQIRGKHRDRIRAHDVGFVFQQFNLLHGRTALDNVIMPLLYGSATNFWKRKKLAIEMLNLVGLGDRLQHKVEKLSGGEQQRVAIARALVKKPRLIYADEPTGALDIETGIQVMSLLEKVATEHQSALITITHDINIALRNKTIYRLSGGSLEPVNAESLRTAVVL